VCVINQCCVSGCAWIRNILVPGSAPESNKNPNPDSHQIKIRIRIKVMRTQNTGINCVKLDRGGILGLMCICTSMRAEEQCYPVVNFSITVGLHNTVHGMSYTSLQFPLPFVRGRESWGILGPLVKTRLTTGNNNKTTTKRLTRQEN